LAQRLDQLEPPAGGEWLSFDDDRRALRFFNGSLTDPVGALGKAGWGEFELLTTERTADQASELAVAAAKVHLLPPGGVAPSSAAVLDDVGSGRLVAFGGGRVVDSAKGIQAVREGEVAAIPTTLAGSTAVALGDQMVLATIQWTFHHGEATRELVSDFLLERAEGGALRCVAYLPRTNVMDTLG